MDDFENARTAAGEKAEAELLRELNELVERAKGDPGAAFEPEALAALAALQRGNAAEYERIRARLKAAGVRVTGLDAAVTGVLGTNDAARSSQSDRLVKIALEQAALFHDTDGEGYADIVLNGHRETYRVRTRVFRRWLSRAFFESEGKAPGSQATQDALGTIEAKAAFDGPEREVFVRIGEHGGALYLDLGDECWRAVQITAGRWRVVEAAPVRFVRPPGLRPLPTPVEGGSIIDLRPFLNLPGAEEDATEEEVAAADEPFKLVIGFLVAALRRRGPFPVLVVNGEQGGGKSTLARIVRRLIDPSAAAIRTAPRDERDLVIAANNGWMLCLDNLSHIGSDLADAICRVATGAGFGTRKLYTDDEEALFQVCRPQVLNGIPDLATRGDLADRALVLTLPELPEEERRPEDEFWTAFEAAAPGILGALLDAVARGLKDRDKLKPKRMPRMADFCLWVEAAAPALGWPRGAFLRAYENNRCRAVEAIVEADIVAVAVRELIELQGSFKGTAKALLERLNSEVDNDRRRQRDWPKAPHTLSNRLRRAAPSLRKQGIAVSIGSSHGHRFVVLERVAEEASPASPASQGADFADFFGDAPGDASQAPGDAPDSESVTANPLNVNANYAGDAGDASLRTRSNGKEDGEEGSVAGNDAAARADSCALCWQPALPGKPLLPHGDADVGHVWMHASCAENCRRQGIDVADLLSAEEVAP